MDDARTREARSDPGKNLLGCRSEASHRIGIERDSLPGAMSCAFPPTVCGWRAQLVGRPASRILLPNVRRHVCWRAMPLFINRAAPSAGLDRRELACRLTPVWALGVSTDTAAIWRSHMPRAHGSGSQDSRTRGSGIWVFRLLSSRFVATDAVQCAGVTAAFTSCRPDLIRGNGRLMKCGVAHLDAIKRNWRMVSELEVDCAKRVRKLNRRKKELKKRVAMFVLSEVTNSLQRVAFADRSKLPVTPKAAMLL